MRTRVSLTAIVAAAAWAAAASAGGPGDVYNDYVQDGVLSCNHSRADLESVLRSGSLNQYGDPLTLARLKLAVRKQLAGGCRRRAGSGSGVTGATGAGGTGRTGSGQRLGSKRSPGHRLHGRQPAPAASRGGSSSAGNGGFFAGRGLIVGLLVAALAFGGWLTKHALSARD